MQASATTPSTSAVLTLDFPPLPQLPLWHATDACSPKVCILWLNAPHTAKRLVSGLLPFCNKLLVGNALLQAPLVELFRDAMLAMV